MKVGRDVRFATVPEWLIFADISAYAIRIWAVLDRKADSETGYTEVPLSTIARLSRCSVNTVKKAVAELEELGALEVERGRLTNAGDPDSNAYTLRTSHPSSRDGGGSRDDGPGPSPDDRQVRQEVTEGVRHDMAPKDESHIRNPERSLTTRERFEEFWDAYPRKVGKGAARAKFLARLKAGADPDILIAGARRYAQWCVAAAQVGELESAKFIAHPSTWLYQEREEDVLTMPGRTAAAGSVIERARAEHARRFGRAV